MKTIINWARVSAIPGIEYILLLEDGTLWEGDQGKNPVKPFVDTAPYVDSYLAGNRKRWGDLDKIWEMLQKAACYKAIDGLPTVKQKTHALGDVDTKALLFRFLRQWGVTIYKKEYARDIYGIGIDVYSTDHGTLEVEGSLSGYCARFTG